MNAVLIAVLLLLALVLVANTLLAVAFLRGRRDNLKSVQGRDGEALEELHKRVRMLRRKPE